MSALSELGHSAAGSIPGYHNASSNTGAARAAQTTGTNAAAALQAQISREQVQLEDWVSCVSASTPKGKAEIQSISSQISAAQAHIRTIEATASAAKAATASAAAAGGASSTPQAYSPVDAWA